MLSLKIDLLERTFSCRVWQLLFCRSALSTGWGLAHSSKIQVLIVNLSHFKKRFLRQEGPLNNIGYFWLTSNTFSRLEIDNHPALRPKRLEIVSQHRMNIVPLICVVKLAYVW